MKYLGIFILAFLIDYLWAIYIKSAADNKPLSAAVSTTFIFLIGSFITISFIEDRLALIPAAVGGAIGTYVAIKKNLK